MGERKTTVGVDLLAEEDGPVDAFGDTACSTGEVRQALEEAGRRLFFEPAPLRAAVSGGFTLDDFRIDTTAATVTRPAGHTVSLSNPADNTTSARPPSATCAPDVSCASRAPKPRPAAS